MADIRALLKARRQEVRISHPLATYTPSGQLRCSLCIIQVKHASAWEGHLGSKTHRTNAARIKKDERQKRKLEEESSDNHDDINLTVDSRDDESTLKRQRVGPAPDRLPADFFSDPSRSYTPITSDDEESSANLPQANTTPKTLSNVIDLEFERFQRELLSVDSDNREKYDRATVVAEPQLTVVDAVPGVASAQGHQMNEDAERDKQNEVERLRQQKDLEERELIMDRLLDEERVQEEADQRVLMMKARLESLKRKREAKRQLMELQVGKM